MIPGTDYCSLWPDRAFGVDYARCCFDHDNSALDLASHLELLSCVASSGLPAWGVLMGLGVITLGPAYGWLKRRGWAP